MKDEIKEILDNWKYVINNSITVYGETIDFKQIKLLLDYITNLQQENEKLKVEKDKLYLNNTMLKLGKDVYKQGYEDLKKLFNILQNGSDSL